MGVMEKGVGGESGGRMKHTNPRIQAAFDAAASAAAAAGVALPLREYLRIAQNTPGGTLEGEAKTALERLAWYHTYGLCLALKKGRKHKRLKQFLADVIAELDKGPLEAHGFGCVGYGAMSANVDRVRALGRRSLHRTAYGSALYDYTHSVSYFWYQLQHLTDKPEFTADASKTADARVQTLIELTP